MGKFGEGFDPYSIKATMGRPRIYTDLDELAQKCDDYFEWCKGEKGKETYVDDNGLTQRAWEREPEPLTITGLSLFLGFGGRQSLYDYINREDGFSYILKEALSRVENGYERKLSGTTPTGAIFALKNMKWKDKTDMDLGGNLGVIWQETKNYQKPDGNEKV